MNTSGNPKRNKVIVILLCLAGIIGIQWFYSLPLSNPNIGIYNSVSYEYGYQNDTFSYYISGATNITNDEVHRVYVWYNTSALGDLRFAYLVWYNGTNNAEFNGNLTLPWGAPNLDWWTDDYLLWEDYFNSTLFEPIGFTIPKQEPETVVTYQLRFHTWNGTGMEYQTVNKTYTTIYSEAYIENRDLLHSLTGYYLTILPFLIIVILFLDSGVTFFSKEGDFPVISNDTPLAELTKDWLIQRCDKMDDVRNNQLTLAGILVGIGVFWNVVGTNIITARITFLASIVLAIGAFLALMASLVDISVSSYDTTLTSSLVPDGQNDGQYVEQLKAMIRKKEGINKNMRTLMQYSVGFFVASILGDFILPLLPYNTGLSEMPWVSMLLFVDLYCGLICIALLISLLFTILRKTY